MVKIAPRQTETFLARPDPGIRAVVIYGPDQGLVRERGDRAVRAVAGDLQDPFRVVELAAGSVVSDPARLVDEAMALSLIGGRRAVRLREAGDTVAPALALLLAAPKDGDSLVVIEAGDLDKRSRLRTQAENEAKAAAIPCYVEDEAALGRVVVELLGEQGLKVERDAAELLAQCLVGDRMIARNEIAKLALYKSGPAEPDQNHDRTVTLEDVRLMVGDSASLELDEPIWAACDGDFAGLDRALGRLEADGVSPVAVLRAAQRHVQRLHLAVGLARDGGPERAADQIRPPIFFKFRPRFLGQVRGWRENALATALDRLTEAEIACKRTGAADRIVAARALYQIAGLAGRGR